MRKEILLYPIVLFFSISVFAESTYWMKINANSKEERSAIANSGVVIESVASDYVIALGTKSEHQKVKENFKLAESFTIDSSLFDFPSRDQNFHNYTEIMDAINSLGAQNTDIVSVEDIGTSIEGRSIVNIRISTNLSDSHLKPAIAFMGTHHAREHLSTEIPLLLAKYLVDEYRNNNSRIVNLLNTREIHIIPMVNPDGVEHDISTGRYKMWRKNRRRNSDGTVGVDLNRNYDFQWGTGGSSRFGGSDTYMGTTPFSEPETQAVKNFVENHQNINILLSFHTFSELILYPWGHSYNSISNQVDRLTHEKMANEMARWNRYSPQQSSELYIASGDTTDWSYGAHGIISFTFELDPKNMMDGGFYPGQSVIPHVFQKNLEPCLYLIHHAGNPRGVLNSSAQNLGLSSRLF